MTRPWRSSTGTPSCAAQHLDAGADALDQRGPDEHGVERVVEPGDVEVGLEAVDLAAVAVAAHGDVDGAEAALVGPAVEDLGGQQDHPGAGAEHRHAVGEALGRAARTGPIVVEQLRHRRRLAAGHHQRVDAGRARPGCAPRGARRRAPASALRRGRGTRPAAPAPRCASPTWGLRGRRGTSSPAPLGVALVDLVHADAGHRRAEAAADLGQDVRRRGSGWWPRRWPWPAATGRRS